MRIVIAPSRFALGSIGLGPGLGAVEVAEAMALGWSDSSPQDVLTTVPLSDGGADFTDAVRPAVGGELSTVLVTGPDGRSVPATLVRAGDTTYVGAAEAAGLHLVPEPERDPTRTSSYGVGELLAAALATGARRIVVGVGGTATNDGGAGLLAALGVGPRDRLGAGGLALAGLSAADLAGLDQARRRFAGVQLVLAAATDIALLGFHGTSASYAAGKGASAEQAQSLEAALGHYADLATRALLPGRSLLGSGGEHGAGSGAGMARQPGAGAGGGIGFALLLLGATYVDGVQAVMQATGLRAVAAGSDLLLTGEASFDWESLRGGVVAQVAALGLESGVPAIVLAAQALVGRRESMTLGLAATYAIAERAEDLAEAMQDPHTAIRRRAARLARTWSRP